MPPGDPGTPKRPPAGPPHAPTPAADDGTIVGSVPWATRAEPPVPAGPAAIVVRTVAPGDGNGRRSQPDTSGEPEEPTAWQLVRDQLLVILRASPAWTTSLAIHTLILVALAIWIVRLPEREKFSLELGFGTTDGAPGTPGTEEAIVEVPGEETPPVEEAPNEPAEAVATTPPEEPTREPEANEPTRQAEMPAAAVPGIRVALSGREPGRRDRFLGANGGSDATEAAVTAALEWIVRQQKKDGLWSMQGPYQNGGSQENRLAATAMALLALQGAGQTHQVGEHQAVVARGWKRLLAAQQRDGTFDVGRLPAQHELYSHAQATIALCELYGMTRDAELAEPAERALAYCLAAQGPNGGWRYEPGKDGDMSVTGWYMMALKSAEMAGMDVPPEALKRIEGFLDLVATQEGRRYGYRRENLLRDASPVTAAVSAEGLLCRQYLGWAQNDPRIIAGLEAIMEEKPLDFGGDKDVYAWYYITQVAHHAQGRPWARWNASVRAELPSRQLSTGKERGSWDPALDRWGSIGGRLFVTCFSTWMLEVYYRHLPLYGEVPSGR
jgi:hypothetical protein